MGHGFPQNQNQQDINTCKCVNTNINICIHRKSLWGGLAYTITEPEKKSRHCLSASWNQISRWHGLAQEARRLKCRNANEMTCTLRPKARESPEVTRTNAGAQRPSARIWNPKAAGNEADTMMEGIARVAVVFLPLLRHSTLMSAAISRNFHENTQNKAEVVVKETKPKIH